VLDVWPKVVEPAQTAALPTPPQPCTSPHIAERIDRVGTASMENWRLRNDERVLHILYIPALVGSAIQLPPVP
jgi:hypothetical protein